MREAETILQIERDIVWLPKPNEASTILSATMPPLELVTTALAIIFSDDCLLMTNLRHRGWDIPGGHIEPGETPAEAVRREVYEETGAKLDLLHLLGYQRLRLLGPKPSAYNYPYPDCYQVFYWGQVESLDTFEPTTETQGRALFSFSDAQTLSWIQTNRKLYNAALVRYRHL